MSTSSGDCIESNIPMSAPAIKLPGLPDIKTPAMSSGEANNSSAACERERERERDGL